MAPVGEEFDYEGIEDAKPGAEPGTAPTRPCQACTGTGYMGNGGCPACKGTGRMPIADGGPSTVDGSENDASDDAKKAEPGGIHEFAGEFGGSCEVCGWASEAHERAAEALSGEAQKAANNMTPDSHNRGAKGRQREMPMGLAPVLHDGRPVIAFEARFSGKGPMDLTNTLVNEWWQTLRLGHEGMVRVPFEVVHHGYQPKIDKDGDVIGMVEYRRLKAGTPYFEPPRDQEDGLPLFEGNRVQLRREVRQFAEGIETVIRSWEDGDDHAAEVAIRGGMSAGAARLTLLGAYYLNFRAELENGAPASDVRASALSVAAMAFALLESVAAGGADATPPEMGLCLCSHVGAKHRIDAPHLCEAEDEVLMGDGAAQLQACSCDGFRLRADADVSEESESSEELSEEPEPVVVVHEGEDIPPGVVEAARTFARAQRGRRANASVLDESLDIATDAVCGKMHRGHLSPCPHLAADCTFEAVE